MNIQAELSDRVENLEGPREWERWPQHCALTAIGPLLVLGPSGSCTGRLATTRQQE